MDGKDEAVFETCTLYGLDDIAERNETYEVALYMPGYVAIGDDGGGRAILLKAGSDAVFALGHGALGSAEPEQIADDVMAWVEAGAVID